MQRIFKNESPKWVGKSGVDSPTLLLHPKFGYTSIDQESVFIYFIHLFVHLIGVYFFMLTYFVCAGSLAWAFSSYPEWSPLFVAMYGLLIVVVLLLQGTGSRCVGFGSCSLQLPWSMLAQ